MATDYELLDAWANGDRGAATQLFSRHFNALYRFFRTKSSTAVEDLVQDTLAACIAGRDRIRRDSSFRAFLFGAARNVLYAHYRRVRRADVLVEETSVADLDPTPSAVCARREEERALLQGLRRIPLRDQILFELYHWEELSASEVASAMGISEGAVRSRLHRATNALKAEVNRIDVSREVLESTVTDLDRWAASLRSSVDRTG